MEKKNILYFFRNSSGLIDQNNVLFEKEIPKELQKDEDLISSAFLKNFKLSTYFSNSIYDDKEFLLKILEKTFTRSYIHYEDYRAVEFIFDDFPIELKTYPKLAAFFVKKNYFYHKFCRDIQEYLDNRELVFLCCLENPNFFSFASKNLRKDEKLILDLIEKDCFVLEHLEDKNNRKIVLMTLKKNGKYLKYCIEEFKNDFDLVFEAVKSNGTSIQFASEELKNNEIIFLEAIKSNPIAFMYSTDSISKNLNIIEQVVKLNPKCLEYAHKDVKNDKNSMIRFLNINRNCFRFASKELKFDIDLIWISRKRFKTISSMGLRNLNFKWKKWSDQ